MLKKFNEASCQAWKEFGQNIFAYYAQKSDEQSAKTGCIIFGMAWGTLQSGAILGIKRDDWVIALICMTALIGMSHFIN